MCVKDERGYCVIYYVFERMNNLIFFLEVLINYGVNFVDKILDGMIVLYIVCKNGNVKFC